MEGGRCQPLILRGYMQQDTILISVCGDSSIPFHSIIVTLDSSTTFNSYSDIYSISLTTNKITINIYTKDSIDAVLDTTLCPSVNVNNIYNKNFIKVFPNPTNSKLTIEQSNLDKGSILTISNISGKELIRQKITD